MSTSPQSQHNAEGTLFSVVVLVSADAEWRSLRKVFQHETAEPHPYGEWFVAALDMDGGTETAIFARGGWGKVSAAASAQYVIERWRPDLLVNIGTCGGIAGRVELGETILAERTLIYDIGEQMEGPAAAIAHYETKLDLAWLRPPYPTNVRRAVLVSGDRDLVTSDVPHLIERYGAVAGDWESGTIAWVAKRHGTRTLILRTVSDVITETGNVTYGSARIWHEQTERIMQDHVRNSA